MMAGNRRTKTVATAVAALCSLAFSIGSVAAKQPKPQGLWVGGERYFSEFQGKVLEQSGTPKANLAFGSEEYSAPFSIAFDAHQNLWAVFQVVNGLPPPALEISRGDFASIISGQGGGSDVPFLAPESIGFDAAGDLWVVDFGQRLLEFLPRQIKKSGGPTANISITSVDSAVATELRFDGSDNLWVVEFSTSFDPSYPEQIWRFTAADRSASGPANPSLELNVPGQISVLDLAFDSSGNLWLAGSNAQGDEIEMIPAADLGGTGEITPSAQTTITSSIFTPNGSGSCVGDIDFDHSGDLWVSVKEMSSGCGNALVEFNPTQLSAGGNLTPSVIINQNSTETNLFLAGPLRFGPKVP
jgi:hypothetical protein